MAEMFSALLQLMLTTLGAVPLPDAGMLGIATLVITAAVLALAVAVVDPRALLRASPHPLRAIGVSVLLGQSDPAADGHPRPRAPGVARAA